MTSRHFFLIFSRDVTNETLPWPGITKLFPARERPKLFTEYPCLSSIYFIPNSCCVLYQL